MPSVKQCCQMFHVGCPPPVPPSSQPFDCNADWTTCYTCLQHRWSPAKRDWCCHHGGRGCPTPPPPPAQPPVVRPPVVPPVATSAPYDCAADYTTCHHCLEKRWSISKRNWCCTNKGKGCHAFV